MVDVTPKCTASSESCIIRTSNVRAKVGRGVCELSMFKRSMSRDYD